MIRASHMARTALERMLLKAEAAARHRMTYLRPGPRQYGNKPSKYMPHIGKKELAKAAIKARPLGWAVAA